MLRAVFAGGKKVVPARKDSMNIGFIGAGKAGNALARYFVEHGIAVSGFYSRCASSAQDAAAACKVCCFNSPNDVVCASDIVFLTVPDSAISKVWTSLYHAHMSGTVNLGNKIICHCSGCLTSAVFKHIEDVGAHGASFHPLLALSDPKRAQHDLACAHFALEGDVCATDALQNIMAPLGNHLHFMDERDKCRYHAAAVFASNFVLAPLATGAKLLESCGFDSQEARDALAPLVRGNVEAFLACGAKEALTGPVERNDLATAQAHLAALQDEETIDLYGALTRALICIAQEKHPEQTWEKWYGLSAIRHRKDQS